MNELVNLTLVTWNVTFKRYLLSYSLFVQVNRPPSPTYITNVVSCIYLINPVYEASKKNLQGMVQKVGAASEWTVASVRNRRWLYTVVGLGSGVCLRLHLCFLCVCVGGMLNLAEKLVCEVLGLLVCLPATGKGVGGGGGGILQNVWNACILTQK